MRRLRTLVVAAAAFVAAGVKATPANAALGVACPYPTEQIFKYWGDWANYAFVPNGGLPKGNTAEYACGCAPGATIRVCHMAGAPSPRVAGRRPRARAAEHPTP